MPIETNTKDQTTVCVLCTKDQTTVCVLCSYNCGLTVDINEGHDENASFLRSVSEERGGQ